jgi:hypothetical protein
MTFIFSLAVWFLADMPLGNRAMCAAILLPIYFVISVVISLIIGFFYAVAVGGY